MGWDWGDTLGTLGVMAHAWDTYDQYSSAADKYRSDAGVYSGNASLDMRSARRARERGVREVEDIQRKTELLGGRQKAAMGASGVQVGEGSYANLLEDTKTFGQMDAETAWNNAIEDAYGYEISAKNAKNRAKSARDAADDADTNAWLGAAGTIASGLFDLGSDSGWW